MRLFGTSGIRGTLDGLLRPENAAKIGLSIANFFGEDSTILVGWDNRLQSQPVALSLISGIISGGANVIELGITPTPALLYTLKDLKVDGGVMITGSHALPEITGILVFKSDTSELNKDEEKAFEDIYFKENFKRVPWNRVGWIEKYYGAIDHYLENVMSLVKVERVEDFRVVIDPGHGTMSQILNIILQTAGVRVVSINDVSNPTFPLRDPYPRPENLVELGNLTAAGNDLGVGVDGDGDRAIFSDEKGNILWGDVTGALFSREVIKSGLDKRIVVPINTSMMAIKVIEEVGGEIVYSAVGPPAIVSTMKKHGVFFGFEESGKYIWRDAIWYGDAALATLRLLEIMDKSGQPLSKLVQDFPKFSLKKVAIRCEDSIKKIVLNLATDDIKKFFEKKGEKFKLVTLDGSKFIFEDSSWLLIRPSGTEPIFRVFAEAEDGKRLEYLIDIGVSTVKKYIKLQLNK